MAEEEKPSSEESAPKQGSPVLWIVLVGVAALGIGAGATYFLVGGHAEATEAAAAETASEGEAADGEPAAAAPAPFSERLFSLEPFVVNVNGEQYPRFLKVKMELELDRPEDKAELEERLAKIRDAVIVLITSKRLADVTDFEGKALLKEELLARINGALPEPRVKSVLFTEFVVQ